MRSSLEGRTTPRPGQPHQQHRRRFALTSERPNFFVITGGPGAGKTSIIEALARRGFRTVEEVGRRIIRQQLRIGSNALHWGDRDTYRELMLSHAISDYEQVGEEAAPVFFDRGIPGLIGYCRLCGVPVPAHLGNAARLYRYHRKVFVTPPWQAIYRSDAERKQDFSEAIATCETVVSAYAGCGYERVEVPKASVGERIEFILRHVGGAG
jgi:predicted ATPase